MKLRQKSKRDQALDATASIAKTWSEWRLGEKVAKTASKASRKKSKQSGVQAVAKRKPARIAGLLVIVGGLGAVIAKKLGASKAEPLYTPPGPAADMAPPPASPVAAGELGQDAPADGATTVPSAEELAFTTPAEVPGLDPPPTAIDDLVGAPAVNEPIVPEGTETAQDDPPVADTAPDPENLISDTADDDADADAETPTERPN